MYFYIYHVGHEKTQNQTRNDTFEMFLVTFKIEYTVEHIIKLYKNIKNWISCCYGWVFERFLVADFFFLKS